jgi:hypothetical protein
MIVKTRIGELHDELASRVANVATKGHGPSAFVYAVNDGRAVEISEDNGGFWLEFWESSEDEDAGPVKELVAESTQEAINATLKWLQ